LSDFLWRSIPSLAALQFPWRFNIPLTLATAALVTLGLNHLSTGWLNVRRIAMAGVGAIVLVWVVVDVRSVTRTPRWKPELTQLAVGDYLFPSWAQWTEPRLLDPKGIIEISRLTTNGDPARADRRFVSVTGVRRVEFETHEPDSRWITVRRFYYPGWTATNEAGLHLPVRPSPETGLIDMQVPAGVHQISLTLPWSLAEKMGLAISLACVLIVFGVSAPAVGRRQNGTRL